MSKPGLKAVDANINPEAVEGAANPDAVAEKPDPFYQANLRLSQSFTETVGVKKVADDGPSSQTQPSTFFVRVHPSPEYRENFPIIELKDEREEYIVTSALVPELTGELVTKTLFLAINRQGTVFFWPVRLPTADGKDLDSVARSGRGGRRGGDARLGSLKGLKMILVRTTSSKPRA